MSNSSPRYDELMLWNDLRNGEEAALAKLLRIYAKSLISYGRKMVNDDALIEDCIQEVFIQLWQYRQNLKEDVGSVKAYLFAAVRRRIISEIKKNETISLIVCLLSQFIANSIARKSSNRLSLKRIS